MISSARIDFSTPLDPAAPRLRLAFAEPREVLVARSLQEVRPVLEAVDAEARRGAWCVGYLRYEAAGAFDAALATHPAGGPLAWFAVYGAPLPAGDVVDAGGMAEAGRASASVEGWSGLDRQDFDGAFRRIQQAIRDGELYQVNFTAPLRGGFEGRPAALFEALQRAQPDGYAAHIDTGDEQVLSVSPELFFDWRSGPAGGSILARPMKGTAPRGETPETDEARAEHLRTAPKERAENVMIVDLLRNDLSRIAESHSVAVPALFRTQALPTVWQMTSDVTARTRPGLGLADVFAALFPCGSVTGAPKVQAMRTIRALEAGPRGVYCGALGVVRPDGAPGEGGIAATFNVPIRTVVLRGGMAECGIGSGITSDAQADAEWDEWRHKRVFVERASQPFEVLETLALQEGTFRHREEHLARMAGSAAHFGFPWDAGRVQACLDALAAEHPQGRWRARLLLDAAGRPRAEAFACPEVPVPVRLALADRPFSAAHGEFVRHKTTRRAHYAAFAPAAPGVFDTVLWNEAAEITEGTFGNIAALLDGRWVTPPLACGLLPGVGRAVALREGRLVEAVVRLEDVPRLRGWAFLNSLRGWLPAELASGS
ncbi:bifunctional aminodeoxychorismate synthase component I/aminotransferase [Paracidovorax avenae]|uniref:chorismate-binding protein n=1 Tax=Paracidovorax avenae TaxID=80867 RepID=UPI000D206483|nr:chorismate-binding protein [Paracidovorax avenae]AVS85819.1 bifunctional aminodeoxychorismate synthase component I/aminotransferase [Paracidovorax avenae]